MSTKRDFVRYRHGQCIHCGTACTASERKRNWYECDYCVDEERVAAMINAFMFPSDEAAYEVYDLPPHVH